MPLQFLTGNGVGQTYTSGNDLMNKLENLFNLAGWNIINSSFPVLTINSGSRYVRLSYTASPETLSIVGSIDAGFSIASPAVVLALGIGLIRAIASDSHFVLYAGVTQDNGSTPGLLPIYVGSIIQVGSSDITSWVVAQLTEAGTNVSAASASGRTYIAREEGSGNNWALVKGINRDSSYFGGQTKASLGGSLTKTYPILENDSTRTCRGILRGTLCGVSALTIGSLYEISKDELLFSLDLTEAELNAATNGALWKEFIGTYLIAGVVNAAVGIRVE